MGRKHSGRYCMAWNLARCREVFGFATLAKAEFPTSNMAEHPTSSRSRVDNPAIPILCPLIFVMNSPIPCSWLFHVLKVDMGTWSRGVRDENLGIRAWTGRKPFPPNHLHQA